MGNEYAHRIWIDKQTRNAHFYFGSEESHVKFPLYKHIEIETKVKFVSKSGTTRNHFALEMEANGEFCTVFLIEDSVF